MAHLRRTTQSYGIASTQKYKSAFSVSNVKRPQIKMSRSISFASAKRNEAFHEILDYIHSIISILYYILLYLLIMCFSM